MRVVYFRILLITAGLLATIPQLIYFRNPLFLLNPIFLFGVFFLIAGIFPKALQKRKMSIRAKKWHKMFLRYSGGIIGAFLIALGVYFSLFQLLHPIPDYRFLPLMITIVFFCFSWGGAMVYESIRMNLGKNVLKAITAIVAITLILSISLMFFLPPPCKAEGETSWIDSSECCKGLTAIPMKGSQISIIGVCTAKCGNGVCDPDLEYSGNCPSDCGK